MDIVHCCKYYNILLSFPQIAEITDKTDYYFASRVGNRFYFLVSKLCYGTVDNNL